MQNSGIIKTGSIKTSEESGEDTQGITRDLRGMQHRHSISQIFLRKRTNKQQPEELPKKEELDGHIDNVFEHSKKTQPSKRLNIADSVAQSTAAVMSVAKGNVLIGIIGIPASEIITHWRNRHDRDTASKLRENDLSKIESIEYVMLSNLSWARDKTKDRDEIKEIDELIKESVKFFSDVKKKSKEGLVTALGSRLEGFAGSATSLLLGLTILKPASDIVSGYIDSFWLTQQIQPQPYPEALLFYITNLAVKVAAFAGASYGISYVYDVAYNEFRRNFSTYKREYKKEQLKEKGGELLDRIAEKCA